MDPEILARTLQDYLADAPNAVVLEDGELIFDLARSKYSVLGERGKCLLHLWSDERNAVRRVADSRLENGILRLTVQRFGHARPQQLEICSQRDRRSQSARKTARRYYQALLRRILAREFSEYRIEHLSSTMDLKHSFSPVYARGLLSKGRQSLAVLGVNAEETQAAIDGALTLALLWLHHCREREADRSVVAGILLFIPAGRAEVVRARLACLNLPQVNVKLLELNEKEETLALDAADRGNIATRLAQKVDPGRVRERLAAAIKKIYSVIPEAEPCVVSSTELAFRLYGLEVARARIEVVPGSFDHRQVITFGAGAYETELTPERERMFTEILGRVRQAATRRETPVIHYGACSPSDGWNHELQRTLPGSTTGSTRSASTHKFRRSRPPIAP